MNNENLQAQIRSIIDALDQLDVRGFNNHAILVACGRELRTIVQQLSESTSVATESTSVATE